MLPVHPEQIVAVEAEIFIDDWGSDSRPALLKCNDTRHYVVKGLQDAKQHMGKVLTNEQVAGRLALAMGAPVPEVVLVDLPGALIAAEPRLQHIRPGICHGSLYLGDNMGRRGIENWGLAENRPRFARLAVLYGWAGSADDQFIYSTSPPELVYSVDHGHFFGPGNPSWDVDSLNRAGGASPNPTIVSACALTPDELRAAASRLSGVSDQLIGQIVAVPRSDWGITENERSALVEYLVRRRDDLIRATGA